jgi:hypothetical protein
VLLDLLLSACDARSLIQVSDEDVFKTLVRHSMEKAIDQGRLGLAVLFNQHLIECSGQPGLHGGLKKSSVSVPFHPDHEPRPHTLNLEQVLDVQFLHSDLVMKELPDLRFVGRPFSMGGAGGIA